MQAAGAVREFVVIVYHVDRACEGVRSVFSENYHASCVEMRWGKSMFASLAYTFIFNSIICLRDFKKSLAYINQIFLNRL